MKTHMKTLLNAAPRLIFLIGILWCLTAGKDPFNTNEFLRGLYMMLLGLALHIDRIERKLP